MAKPLSSTITLKQFYKQTFEVRGTNIKTVRHTLLVNPEDMRITQQARVNIQQTYGGAFVQDFGAGLKQVSLSGQTGYGARYNADGILRDGYTEIKALKYALNTYFFGATGQDVYMYWYNWEDEEYYRIVPTAFNIARNKNEPTLYRYELQFTCIESVAADSAPKPKVSTNKLSDLSISRTSEQISLAMSGLSEALYEALRKGTG